MNELTTDHYRALLGLDSNWKVSRVEFLPTEKSVDIWIQFCGSSLNCPGCKERCTRADMAPERSWRHLDTMQFTTTIHASIPRSQCEQCGVLTVAVPWADKHSRFTLLFESFASEVIQACSNVKSAAALLGINWKSAHTIMERAVNRGMAARDVASIRYVGIDEKSFGKGHDYVSVMTDIENSRVLEVEPERTRQAVDNLWEKLSETQRKGVEAVAMDMWQPFMESTKAACPSADVVHDRFHVSKYMGEGVDKVRRHENKTLIAENDSSLKGTRQLWLYSLENLPEDRRAAFLSLQKQDLQTGRAWSLKENFRHFWECKTSEEGNAFFQTWYAWANRSQLAPMIKVAGMLKRHLAGLLTYMKHRITNATSEGFNSRIQSIKSAARGFKNFSNYRIRILFFCGKLELIPNDSTH
jgi:transposase